jgi:hypothetical protein
MARNPERNTDYSGEGAFREAISRLPVRTEIKQTMNDILNLRNQIEYRQTSPTGEKARTCARKLTDVLAGVYSPLSR